VSWHVKVVPNRYADSVKLMGIARQARGRPGIDGCELAMGTPANLAVLESRGVRADAGPSDLIIAVDAGDDGVAQEAVAEAEAALAGGGADGARASGGPLQAAPRSLVAAARGSRERTSRSSPCPASTRPSRLTARSPRGCTSFSSPTTSRCPTSSSSSGAGRSSGGS
jgi:hypothetical protein